MVVAVVAPAVAQTLSPTVDPAVAVAQVVLALAKGGMAMVSVAVAARMATKVEATALRRAAGSCSPEATKRWWESSLPCVFSWL